MPQNVKVSRELRFYTVGLVTLWTLVVFGSLVWNLVRQEEETRAVAHAEAHAAYELDIIYKCWNAQFEGVYVPITKDIVPDPHLAGRPERDIVTESGRQLTLVTPKYMFYQIGEMLNETEDTGIRLTHLDPARSDSVPDPWEAEALAALQDGAEEVSTVAWIDGKAYMRILLPYISGIPCTKQDTLDCSPGETCGAMSISVPMAPLWAAARPQVFAVIVGHLTLWAAGAAVVLLTGLRLHRYTAERNAALAALGKSEANLTALIENQQGFICSVDREYRLIVLNSALKAQFAQVFGIKLEPGMRMIDYIPPERYEEWAALYDRVLSGEHFMVEQSYDQEGRTAPPSQAVSIDEVSFNPIYAENGRITGAAVYVRDVTEQRRSEFAEREQRALAEALSEAAAALNSTLDFDEVLERVLTLIGRVLPYDAANIMLIENNHARVIRTAGYYVEHGIKIQELNVSLERFLTFREIIETGAPCLISDTRGDPRWVPFPESTWIRSYAGAPIRREGNIIGFLNIESAMPDTFTPKHAERLMAFADQASVAIENARLFEAEQRRRQIAETLRQTSTVLSSTLELDKLLTLILGQLREVIPYDSTSIQQLQDDSTLEIVACHGFNDPEKVIGIAFPLDSKHPNHRVIETKAPLYLQHVNQAYPVFGDASFHATRIHSWLGVPLIAKDETIGMITLDWFTEQVCSEEDIEVVMAFANQAAIALENAGLYQQLEAYSETLEQAVAKQTKELRRIKEHVEAILENSPDAVMLLRKDGAIDQVNLAFEELFGYDRDEICNHRLCYLIDAGHRERCHQIREKVLETCQSRRTEAIFRRKDGSAFDADFALAPITEGEQVTSLVCSLRDISKLKAAERMKDTFVANVSHELRTPVTSLKLYHDLLKRNPTKHNVYMAHLDRETERLHRIIEDLLNLSRMDQRQVPFLPRPIELNKIMRQYVDDRTAIAESRQLTLTAEADLEAPLVRADAGLVGQALSILLTNALNYTPPGGHVTARTQTRSDEGQVWVGLTVRDDGPGIPPEEQQRLFERFFRGTVGRESGAAGTGLGLALVKEIVNRHQGKVEVESAPGEGAAFTIWLPAAE